MGAIEKHGATAPMAHDDVGPALRLAEQLATARGIIPDHLVGKPGNIVAILLTGRELGLPPMASLRGLQVVKGKVGASYDTMVGLLRRAGYRVEWPESGPESATLRLTHPDGSQHEETWDKARATTAGLWGGRGPWSSYPETMLRARAVSSAGRAFAGDVMSGVYSTDEVRELEGRGPAEVRALPETEPQRPDHPLVQGIEDLVEPVAAGEMRAEDARQRVWAAIDAADSRDVRRGIAKAAYRIVHAVDPELDRAAVVQLGNRWVTQAPIERRRVEEPVDAELEEGPPGDGGSANGADEGDR